MELQGPSCLLLSVYVTLGETAWMLCSSSISNRDIIKVPSQRLLLTEGIWSSSVFSSSAFSDNSKDLGQTRTSVQLGSSGKLSDGRTDGRTDERITDITDWLTYWRIHGIDWQIDGWVLCEWWNCGWASSRSSKQAMSPISGNFEWYETDRNCAAWMICKRLNCWGLIRSASERILSTTDKVQSGFLPTRWTFLRQDRDRDRQNQTDRVTDRQRDRQGNNGKTVQRYIIEGVLFFKDASKEPRLLIIGPF